MAILRRARRRGSEVNVGPVQRTLSLAAGTGLVVLGLRRRRAAGGAAALLGGDLLYRGATGYCHVLGALGIDTSDGQAREVAIQRSITVQLPREDVYARWREPRMQELVWSDAVQVTGATEQGAHWRLAGPLGRTFEWETRILEERPGELIRWESTGEVRSEGAVEFRDGPGEWGTEITLRVRFQPPGGRAGAAVANLVDEPPKLALAKALRRFKSLVETGEMPSTDRNPSARAG